MICPHCGKLISVSEPECPFCGAKAPSLYGYAPALQKLFGRKLDFVALIVGACIVLYILTLVLQPDAILRPSGGGPFGFLFGLLSPGTRALYQLGMTGGPAWDRHWWWTLFTAIYLHGSLLHIFFNVMWIRNLAPSVDEFYGPARGFVIFTIAGAVGFLLSNVATGTPTVGASGSIFGLLAALIVYGRRTGASILTQQLWQWAIVMFVMGFVMSAVNNWAHAGGFAGGWVAAEAMQFSHVRRESIGIQVLALALLALTAVGFCLSFWTVTSMLIGR